MILHIDQREREGIVILDLHGSILLGEEVAVLRDRIEVLTISGRLVIALNLDGIKRIDSTGLGALVFAFTRLQKCGGRLTMFNLKPTHVNLMVMTKLATVFEIFPDEQAAVNACFPARALNGYDILVFVQQESQHG